MDSLTIRLIRSIDLTLDWADTHEDALNALSDDLMKGAVVNRLIGFMDQQGLVVMTKEDLRSVDHHDG